jgi:hypothetical protein
MIVPAAGRRELRIRPRTEMLARLGVSTEGLATRSGSDHRRRSAGARIDTGDRLMPIHVQLEDYERS